MVPPRREGAPPPLPTDRQWAVGSPFDDVRELNSREDPETLWRAIEPSIADRDWSTFPFGRPMRGWIDGPRRAAGIRARNTSRKVKQMDDKTFRKGDQVEWRSHGVTVHGTVERTITADTEAAGRTVRASKDEPQCQVRSRKTCRDAVHKPDALHHSD
jgi:hypothetical protein